MPKKNMIKISTDLLDKKIVKSKYANASELAEDCYLNRNYFNHVRSKHMIPISVLNTVLGKLKITMEDFMRENDAALLLERAAAWEAEAAPSPVNASAAVPDPTHISPLERIADALEGILREISTRQLTINDLMKEED